MASDSVTAFCVIPPHARSSRQFLAVNQQGVVLEHDGKAPTYPFGGGVYAVAHDLYGKILKPLFNDVAAKRNCAVLFCHPPSSEEASDTVLDMCNGMLSALFEHVPAAQSAVVSMLEIPVGALKDVASGKLCAVQNVQPLTALRSTADQCWSNVIEQMALRGRSAASSEGPFFVHVAIEGQCEFLLGDVGVLPNVLRTLTLLLHSQEEDSYRRTAAPKVPLATLLEPFLPPKSAVHVVAIPDPEASLIQTARVLHFASSFERDEATCRELADACAGVVTSPPPKDMPPHAPVRSLTQQVQQQYVPAKPSRSPAHTAVYGEQEAQRYTADWQRDLVADNTELFVPVGRSAPPTVGNDGSRRPLFPDDAGNDSSSSDGEDAPPLSVRQTHNTGEKSKHGLVSRKAVQQPASNLQQENATKQWTAGVAHDVPPPPEYTSGVVAVTPPETSRTVTILEGELRRVQVANDELMQSLHQAQLSKQESDEQLQQTKKENENLSQLVDQLLKRVEASEQQCATAQEQASKVLRERDVMSEDSIQLRNELNAAKRAVKQMEQRESGRVRSATLASIAKPRGKPDAASSPRGTVKPSTKAAETETKQQQDPSTSASPQQGVMFTSEEAQRMSVADAVVMKQLRRKVEALEQENAELRHSVTAAASVTQAPAKKPSTADLAPVFRAAENEGVLQGLKREIDVLKQQLAFQTIEAGKANEDKEALRKVVMAHPRSAAKDADTVDIVAQSLAQGCDAMIELVKGASAARPTALANSRAQSVVALEKLKSAILGIAEKRPSAVAPSTSTTEDVPLLDQLLAYEIERMAHLKALLPAFAQLLARVPK